MLFGSARVSATGSSASFLVPALRDPASLEFLNQTLLGHDQIHLDQETLGRVRLRLPVYSASAKDICFIGAQPFGSCEVRISPNLEVFFRVSLAICVVSSDCS
jgi:hypothetical protein